MNDCILISFLDVRIEEGQAGPVGWPGCWRTVPYEAEGFSGVMLACGEATWPAPIRVRLNVEGPHRIFLGLFAYSRGAIRVRLTHDLCCTRFDAPRYGEIEPPVFHEIPWKACDLSGQDLFLESVYDRSPLPGALAYIRIEPMDDLAPAPARPDIWRAMCVTNDGCGVFRKGPHHRPEDILESLETVPDRSCVQSLLWGNGNADNCNYPTEVGNPMLLDKWQDPHLAGDGAATIPNMKRWQERRWDSLRLVREYTRQREWELHVYIRMEAFAGCYPHEELVWSKFFYAHPEWHCLDRRGNRVNRLSYAYPAVQDHMLALISEILAYGPDGVCLCLTRGIPVMLYEPVMVTGFQEAHGVDPRTLDELDSRWLAYQAEIFTSFVRRAKARMGAGQRLSVMVPGNEEDCRKWGLDVAAWVDQCLVDDVYPVGQRFNATHTHFDAPAALDFAYFQAIPGRERIRLIPSFYTWTMYHTDPVAYRKLIRSLLEQGADQYCIWDGADRFDDRKLGDIGCLNWSGPDYEAAPPASFGTVNVHALNGFRIDQYGGGEIV